MLTSAVSNIQHIVKFLKTPTPTAWCHQACERLPILLIDHAHCERKAAATALQFMSKYPEQSKLISLMSPLAREELLHFEKVLNLLKSRNIALTSLKPCHYAQRLHQEVTKNGGKERLSEQLIIAAIIEARSCERFACLAPHLDDKILARFYSSLVKAEARHYESYINLAYECDSHADEKISRFITLENKLITSFDTVFRVHSGILTS